MTNDSTTTFKPLTSANFYEWKPCMMALLQAKGLWGIVIGKTERMGDTKVETEKLTVLMSQASWDEKDMRAMGLIASNVAEGKEEIVNSTSAAEAWKNLVAQYDRKGLTMVIRLRTELYLGVEGSVGTQINFVKEKARHLEALGEQLSSIEKTAVLLASIDKKFSFVITALQATWDKLKKDEKLDFSTVTEALLNEEVRLQDSGDLVKKEVNAGALIASGWNGSQQGGNQERLCWVCERPGHIKNDCPVRKAGMEALAAAKIASTKPKRFVASL